MNQNNPQWGDGGRAGFRDEPWSDRSAASEPNEGETAEPGVQPRGMGSPISDEAHNVITALQAKLEGLEAYRKYAKDGGAGIWEQLTQIETQGVSMLVDELERIVKDGKLRGGSRIA